MLQQFVIHKSHFYILYIYIFLSDTKIILEGVMGFPPI